MKKIYDILTYPELLLNVVSIPIHVFNPELSSIANNLVDTIYNADAYGLAAIQVGIPIRMFVMDCKYKTMNPTIHNPLIICNPTIISCRNECIVREGCLSLPNGFTNIKRYDNITIAYQDLNGNVQEKEASGLEAQCIQHEIDHLNGITNLDRVDSTTRELLIRKILKKKNKRKE